MVLAALVPGAAPAAAASGAAGPAPGLPRVLTCAGKAVVRPARYVLACTDANTCFEAIHWKTWTRTSALPLQPLPAADPADGGPGLRRLYAVRFYVVCGNAVLPAGRACTQFAYVARQRASAPWCYRKGGSGP